ncbi:putative hydroxymethylglutaryl-CoA lyase [Mycobacterium xenopi 3993]|nr:putative hydroxymethylglutaryl-CoA lyase [Mycobacterium xenopi 3993]
MTPHVTIREVALRDGLQIEAPIPLSDKLKLLAAIAATGVREVEACAFVSASKVPSMADAAELAAELHRFPASSSPPWWPAQRRQARDGGRTGGHRIRSGGLGCVQPRQRRAQQRRGHHTNQRHRHDCP